MRHGTRSEGKEVADHPNKHIREAIRYAESKMYGTFNDGTISTIAGVPQIRFHREAGSLEDAIRSAIGDVRSIGFDVERVEMEPNAVVQSS